MAKGKEAETAYENPLIPNARLRQIYLAMVQARALGKALTGRHRVNALEACLVSTAVDLGPRDLISDALTGGAVEFLRGATLESVLTPEARGKKRGLKAECGSAERLPAGPGVEEQVWIALGAAAALKGEHARARRDAEPDTETPGNVVVMYVQAGKAAPELWHGALTFAAVEELPVVFVALPSKQAGTTAGMSDIALEHGVPGIAVDADDAVAIYRVAQESIARARIGGGPALMECIPFLPEGKLRRSDGIVALERYMLDRQVAKKSWMERVAKAFAKRLALT